MGLKPEIKLLTERISKIIVDIYVIGEYPWGECILFVLKINDIPKFSVIVDSCEKAINILNEKLKEYYKIKTIDMLCWTHPHKDHSVGMIDFLTDYCGEKTLILEPQGIEISKEYIDDESKVIYDYLNKINMRNKKKYGKIAFAAEGKTIKNVQYIYDNTNNLNLNIETYSPVDEKINNMKNNKNKKINDYSILMCITINNWKFIFSGDIENKSINYLKEKYEKFYNVIFLKIPHHGSKSSENFIDLIEEDNNNIICNSTTYNNKDIVLPKVEVLNKYNNLINSQVFCTNLRSLENNKENTESYGIISTRYELYNDSGKYSWDCKKEGDAYNYSEYYKQMNNKVKNESKLLNKKV